MLRKPLSLEVFALPPERSEADQEFLEDLGLTDIYDCPTFMADFYVIDHIFPDYRSRPGKPITLLYSSGECYMTKISKTQLKAKIEECR
jgi:hypothetical protein